MMYSWRDPVLLPLRPVARPLGHRGGRRAGQPVAAHARPAHLADGRPVEEVSGYWANLNHPYIEVEDTAVAILRFRERRAGLDRHQPVAEAGHLHQGAHPRVERRVGRRRDRPGRDLHRRGLTAITEPPLNDLWTIPGEEDRLAAFQAEDRARFARCRYRDPLPRPPDPRLPPRRGRGPASSRRRRGWATRRRAVPGRLRVPAGRAPIRLPPG